MRGGVRELDAGHEQGKDRALVACRYRNEIDFLDKAAVFTTGRHKNNSRLSFEGKERGIAEKPKLHAAREDQKQQSSWPADRCQLMDTLPHAERLRF